MSTSRAPIGLLGLMQVPPQRSAFQVLMSSTDSSNHLPKGDLSELSEVPDASADASFISVISPLMKPDQLIAPNGLPVHGVAESTAEDGFARAGDNAAEPAALPDGLSPSATVLPVYRPSSTSTHTRGGEGAGMPDTPQLVPRTKTAPSATPSLESHRSDVFASGSAVDSRLATKAVDTQVPPPQLPEKDTIFTERSTASSERQNDGALVRATSSNVVSRNTQPVEQFIATTVHEVDPPLESPVISRPSPTRAETENGGQRVEPSKAAIDGATTRLEGDQLRESAAEVTPRADRSIHVPRDPSGRPPGNVTGENAMTIEQRTQQGSKPATQTGAAGETPSQQHGNQTPVTVQTKHNPISNPTTEGDFRSRGEPTTQATPSLVPHVDARLDELRATVTESVPASNSSPSVTTQSTPIVSSNSSPSGPTVTQSVEIAAQIVEAIHLETALESQRAPRLEVRLDPPELGKVWIELSEGRDGLMAKITVSRADTHQLLEGELAQIRASLDEAGVQVSEFQVGHDQSRFQDESQGGMTRSGFSENAENDVSDADDREVQQHGPQGSRIDVRL